MNIFFFPPALSVSPFIKGTDKLTETSPGFLPKLCVSFGLQLIHLVLTDTEQTLGPKALMDNNLLLAVNDLWLSICNNLDEFNKSY